ncbi:unconventional myosin-Ic isoform X11 [Phyllopteryx taeniolatus]|uniref:unconventional myosin-Ic isoform X11 n=1 Tax=Phyllopteryx taeniolatus TaxID=161469 RepID=UPI002AD4DD06|nr:unconventional myosin-Ic isoform X11 [Phyllopteryx taeniolatus]
MLVVEGALNARNQVGIQDFVLLDETSEAAFLSNLKKRFCKDLIYTYIGTLLVSVNPYKELDIYNKEQMDVYMGVNFYELPPHIYALADNAYHGMLADFSNHFILISGESGAGKTEASKKILQYYAVSCPSTALLNTVRDKMLMSNPVLEAFGNAKTLKNDNSSRFGKYMDIQFDSQGDALGGHILNYLLEKSRVVHQNHGERNFHIFYQLLDGGEEDLLQQLGLERDRQHYSYLTQLLGVDANSLQEGLTYRKIEAKTEQVLSPFLLDHAIYGRDALAKAIYGHTFTWLVNRINASTENTVSSFFCQTGQTLCDIVFFFFPFQDPSKKTVIGLLDIYGFEVFNINSFEQFCINYCNEKLQQLFIQLTLKAEQEEYEAEDIEWEPVHFFNNKIICDLVEERHRGIISILDEECLRPGEATDLTFLERLEEQMGTHPHFVSHKLADKKTRRTLERGDFRLLHYAGEVTYCVVGFLDKNNDLLYKNIKDLMCQSKNAIVRQCFSCMDPDSRRRPETVATQFKSSLLKLTEILVAKDAWYIRCLKSNESKKPGQFDEALIRHQIKYLGLMQHLRVRRAGFAYRRKYEVFLQRYKALCPATWPHWRGEPADGVLVLVRHLGYFPNEYKMGSWINHRTKIFIRHPRTLYATEDAFEKCKHQLATRLQAKYKGYRAKGVFRKQKEAATKIETCWRGVQARKERDKRAWAVKVIKRFIKGYMTRGQAKVTDNSEYLVFVRQNYLNRLQDNLPKTLLDKTTWLSPPHVLAETSELLRKLHYRLMVRKYVRGITTQKKTQLQMKLIASAMFKGKKESYPQSVAQPFVDTRISDEDINARVLQMLRNEHIKYAVPMMKYDRNGFKRRPRQLIFTQAAAYMVEEARIKQRILYTALKGISVSNLTDSIVVLHITCEDPKEKGDLVLQCNHLFELVTKLCIIANKQNVVRVLQGSIKVEIQAGKESAVEFSTGPEPMVYKAKNGHLTVVATRARPR